MVLKRHAVVVLCFLGLACLTMYWILFNLPGYMPGDKVTDYYHFNWNFWWVQHVLTTPGLNIYATSYVFAPATSRPTLHSFCLVTHGLALVVYALGAIERRKDRMAII